MERGTLTERRNVLQLGRRTTQLNAVKDLLWLFPFQIADPLNMPTRLYNLFASLTPDEQLAISPFAEATMHQWSPQQRCVRALVSVAFVYGPRQLSVGMVTRLHCAQAVLP